MMSSDQTSRQQVALIEGPQDALDHATALKLAAAGFRVMRAAGQGASEPLDVAVIRARAAGDGEADIAASLAMALQLTRAAAAGMSRVEGGRIIYVLSSLGRYRSAWFRSRSDGGSRVGQAAFEGALVGQTRQLAFELAPRRIRVNAVAHGWIRGIDPEPDAGLSEREKEALLAEISLRRPGEPDEVAAVITFLAGPASSYITGTILDVNGGWWVS
jgi:3-oxoacyl-[acyl-carrier protein] reductase